jgi:uncharacterized BrkB/YihY/UPF0761 family membrane protein
MRQSPPWATPSLQKSKVLLQAATLAVTVAVTAIRFAMIYKVLPNTKAAWAEIRWISYSTQVFLFGAEITAVHAGRRKKSRSRTQ